LLKIDFYVILSAQNNSVQKGEKMSDTKNSEKKEEPRFSAIIKGQKVKLHLNSVNIQIDEATSKKLDIQEGTPVEILAPSGNTLYNACFIVVKVLGGGKFLLGSKNRRVW
jgi:hypothetical protein